MAPKISIIVPIYNTEMFLVRCLDSLAAQTLKDIEIILIDDGSTDGSGEIADRYAAQDDRFRAIHQANQGLSAARNAGIELAKADYLMFVDSDDWVEPDFCQVPFETALTHGAELVFFRYWRDGFRNRKKRSGEMKEGAYPREEAMRLLYQEAGVNTWSKLYHKRLFEAIRYPVGHMFEDYGTTHRLVQAATLIWASNRLLYHYCYRRESITNSLTDRSLHDLIQMGQIEAEDLKAFGYPELAQERSDRIGYICLIRLGTRDEMSKPYLSKYRAKESGYGRGPWKKQVMLGILRASPALFDLTCLLAGKRKRSW